MTFLTWYNLLRERTRSIVGTSAKIMLIGACENHSGVWRRLLVDDVRRSPWLGEPIALAGRREPQPYRVPVERAAICEAYHVLRKPRVGPPTPGRAGWRRYLSFNTTP